VGSLEVVEAQLFHDEVLQVEPEKRLRHSWRGGSDELEGSGADRDRDENKTEVVNSLTEGSHDTHFLGYFCWPS